MSILASVFEWHGPFTLRGIKGNNAAARLVEIGQSHLKDKNGVYMLVGAAPRSDRHTNGWFNHTEVLYVGKAEDQSFYDRLKQHLDPGRGSHAKLFEIENTKSAGLESIWLGHFRSFKSFSPKTDIETIENLIIHGLDPWLNKNLSGNGPSVGAIVYNQFDTTLWQKHYQDVVTGKTIKRPKWRPSLLPTIIEYTPSADPRLTKFDMVWTGSDGRKTKPMGRVGRGKGAMLNPQ